MHGAYAQYKNRKIMLIKKRFFFNINDYIMVDYALHINKSCIEYLYIYKLGF